MKCLFRDNRGQALVELALVVPILTLLMLGAVELGRIAYFAIEIESSARAGASYGSVNRGTAGDITMIKQAAADDVPDISNLNVTPGTACVCQTITNSSTGTSYSYQPASGTTACSTSYIKSCSAVTATSRQVAITYVTVATSAQVDPIIHLPGLPQTFTLHGSCKMRVLQN